MKVRNHSSSIKSAQIDLQGFGRYGTGYRLLHGFLSNHTGNGGPESKHGRISGTRVAEISGDLGCRHSIDPNILTITLRQTYQRIIN